LDDVFNLEWSPETLFYSDGSISNKRFFFHAERRFAIHADQLTHAAFDQLANFDLYVPVLLHEGTSLAHLVFLDLGRVLLKNTLYAADESPNLVVGDVLLVVLVESVKVGLVLLERLLVQCFILVQRKSMQENLANFHQH